MRVELRDYDTPRPYRFSAKYTPDAFIGHGALLLEATERTLPQIRAERAAEDVINDVREFVADNPRCSKRAVRKNVTGGNAALDRALELLLEQGQIYEEFDERARSTGFHLAEVGHRAERAS